VSGDSPAVRAVAAALRGDEGPPLAADAVDAAIAEAVAPLLAASAAASTLDAPSRARLRAHVYGSTIHAAALDDELRRLLSRLAAGGLTPIVFKGAHLAHAVYATPSLRPRADTDLLIAPSQRRAIVDALAAAGYTPSALTSGTLILGQFLHQKTLGPGVVHYVDVHWRAAAPLVFADAFDAASIAAAAVPIPGLGSAARGPAAPDALALACVHVVAHHWPEASLRWLYDLHLLAAALDDESRALRGGRLGRTVSRGRGLRPRPGTLGVPIAGARRRAGGAGGDAGVARAERRADAAGPPARARLPARSASGGMAARRDAGARTPAAAARLYARGICRPAAADRLRRASRARRPQAAAE